MANSYWPIAKGQQHFVDRKTGMNLTSKIGIGTVQFGTDYGISNEQGKTKPEGVKAILNYAREAGIDTLDTASAYGNAEEVLGQNDLRSFSIVSKFMPPENGHVADQLNSTLNALQIDQLHGYLAHRPQAIIENPDEWKRLNNLKDQGLIRKIGFSLNHPEELKNLLDKKLHPDLIQVPYNYFDRRFEDFIQKFHSEGCEVHTRSTFLQGLFFVHPKKLGQHFNEIKPSLKRLQDSTKNLSGFLLKFVLNQPHIDKVIVGVENLSQLKSNLKDINESYEYPPFNTSISENILNPSRWPGN